MRYGRASTSRAVVGFGAALSLAWLGAGCEAQPGGNMLGPPNARFAPTSANIIEIHKYVSTEPWLRFRRDAELDGIKINALYLIDGTGKGAFGEGTILVNLYRIDDDPAGGKVATRVYEWSYDTDEAMPYRAKRRTLLGWGYQLRLHWGDLELAGRQIEVEILFERPDGGLVGSQPSRFLVPPLRARRSTVVRRTTSGPPRTGPVERSGPGGRSVPPRSRRGPFVGTDRPTTSQPVFVPRADD